MIAKIILGSIIYSISPMTQFLLMSLVPVILTWQAATHFFSKKKKQWQTAEADAIDLANRLVHENGRLKEKLAEAHADIESKTTKIAQLTADKKRLAAEIDELEAAKKAMLRQ